MPPALEPLRGIEKGAMTDADFPHRLVSVEDDAAGREKVGGPGGKGWSGDPESCLDIRLIRGYSNMNRP